MGTRSRDNDMGLPAPDFVPGNMMSIVPYLETGDGGRDLLDFMVKVLHAKASLEIEDEGKLQHAEVSISACTLEMSGTGGGNPQQLHVYVPDADEVFKRAMENGAKKIFDVMDMPYGERGGRFEDGSGNRWHVSTYNAKMDESMGKLMEGKFKAHQNEPWRPEHSQSVRCMFTVENCLEMIEFMKRVLGLEQRFIMVNPEQPDDIWYAEMQSKADGAILVLGSKSGDAPIITGNVHIYVPDVASVLEKLQKEPKDSFKMLFDLAAQPYGEKLFGFEDKWGAKWYVASHTCEWGKEYEEQGTKIHEYMKRCVESHNVAKDGETTKKAKTE